MTNKKQPSRNNGLINQATTLSAQGKDKQALELIERHLDKTPDDPGALNLAGTLAARMENWTQAEKYFSQSLSLNAQNPYALYTLAKIFKLTDRPGEAVHLLTQLITLEPRNVPALNEIGVLMTEQGHVEAGQKALKTALEIDPSFEMAYRNLYTTLYFSGQYEEAVLIVKNAIDHIKTDYRWNFRTDLILCLYQSRAFVEAKQAAESLIEELEKTNDPAHQEALVGAINNYGLILMELGDPEKAEIQYNKVIAIDPTRIDPYINLARLNGYRENFEEAIKWFQKAADLDPENASLNNHLALFMRESANRPDLAIEHHLRAIAKEPGNAEARYYLGMTQLALGNLPEAYKHWELRWTRREGGSKSDLPIPEWTGTPPTGRSILVYREQGIGDEIIFANCLPDLSARFERILCVCHRKLTTLFSRSFPQIEFRSGGDALDESDLETLDWQIAVGSLPPIFRPTLESVPTNPQLLTPDPTKVEVFLNRISPHKKTLTIGIGWRSGLLSVNRESLYPYLEFWQAIFDIPDITWVNLQYGDTHEELRQAENQFGISILDFDDVDHLNDLDTSAALMKACDLIIAPGTSTSMIAAAVGTPTIRLASGCDPFQLGTDHYPWLPSLTPLRRHFGDSWTPLIEQTAAIVNALVSEKNAESNTVETNTSL